jgi:hypothetical protein
MAGSGESPTAQSRHGNGSAKFFHDIPWVLDISWLLPGPSNPILAASRQ